jgi:hypothetical protein
LNARRSRRLARLRVGAAIDGLAELALRTRRPHGLLHPDVEVTAERLETAIGHATRFLERVQEKRGVLRGFLLLPGAATTWLTAHTAFVLEDVRCAQGLCARAAEYLHAIGATDGGWGYNRRVAPDCDSSAQALMVIARFGLRCEPFLVNTLAAAQAECGGFPTYAASGPPSGWQAPHPEVAALVAEALRRAGGFDDRVDRCSRWLDDCTTKGVLPSYWWSDDSYALWVQARTRRLGSCAMGAVRNALEDHRETPQLAMALSAAAELGLCEGTLLRAARLLVAQQYSDGSWACSPCLRVTSPKTLDACADAAGPMAADRRRVFSTAHAIAALHRVQKRLYS